MTGREQARRLIHALRTEAKIRGHGTQTQALRECGLDPDYLYNVAPERIPLGTYLDLVGAAGLDPATQAQRVLDPEDPIQRLIEDGRRIRTAYTMPVLIDRARRQGAATKRADDGGFDLEAIDTRRYDDTQGAIRLARQAVQAARGPDAVASALGVWASCQRMAYRLDLASGALGLAVEIADTSGCVPVLLRELQRASSLLKDRGEFDFALCVARRVATGYLERGLHEHFGQAVTDCAVVLIYTDLNAAGNLARLALTILTPDSPRHRAAAHHIVSRERADAGDLAGATRAADCAAHWAQLAGGTLLNGRIQWLRAIVASQAKDYRTAERHYHQALEALSAASYDALLVGAELVRVLLKAARPVEAYDTARSLAWFHQDLEHDPLDVERRLVAALHDLVAAGREARLTIAIVDGIIKRIHGGRRRRLARLRRNLRA